MNYSKLCLAMVAAMICGASAQADVALKIYRGDRDTVYSRKHYIIGVTTAGNSATINGEAQKVYNTGSFGSQYELKEGNNAFEVVATDGVEKTVKKFNVFYTPDKPETKMTLEEAKAKLAETTLKSCDFYAVSKSGAFMQFGDGGDRLGGSKMNFVDEGIVFKVVGEIGELYKVQLSQNRYAFIEKIYLDKTDETTSVVNTGSWYVCKDGKVDRVSIGLPKRLPYHVWTELDPTRICLDIFGAMNNSNWMTQLNDTEMVDYVDYRQVESDVYRVIIKLKKEYAWGFSVEYEETNLVVKVKHTPNLDLKGMTVGLDAGHGGKYPGAVSPSGITEKELNMSLIYMVRDLLEAKGAKVVLSRDGDVDVSMKARKDIFKKANVDIMISLHHNSGGKPLQEMGSCTTYKHIVNRKFASVMFDRLIGMGHKRFGMVGNFNFSLNYPTEYPNVLLEVLFMSSLPEEEKLADMNYRRKIAKQVVAGLEDYLKIVKESEKK